MSNIQLWQGPNGLIIPPSAKHANDIVPYAYYLTEKQKEQIISAFTMEAYDMAAEYAWKKAMVKLKETISTLGMKFIGEMLGRDDIKESSSIENVLTDHTTIELAEQLGVIGKTAALKLRQANELITHYFSQDAESELDYADAFSIAKSSIQYILGEQNISVAIEFSKFRDRLLGETLKITDPQVEQLMESPLFYLRTTLTILLSSIKKDIGAKLEHALANFTLIIEPIWGKLAENDKWNIGTTYRDVTAAGNLIAASGLKNGLLKVNGFDFVPENLRSLTFKSLAKKVLETHYAYNNFYNEPAVVKQLASLGTTIPAPALTECMQAYLAVCIGNRYGVSTAAASIAADELSKITEARWIHYFSKIIQFDEVTLIKLDSTDSQIERFKRLLVSNNLDKFTLLPDKNQIIYNAIIQSKYSVVKRIADEMYNKLKE
jgi:hypothetical protein